MGKLQLRELEDLRVWLLFTIGACWMTAGNVTSDPGRLRRARWAGTTLFNLRRCVGALFELAARYPGEFGQLMGEPIEIEEMPE